ncbi:hypothetical protein YN80_07915 [Campylobacter coli]|nr:hypothetical protein [Campylobacter coli]
MNKKLILTKREDAFGSRMQSFIGAMYIAKKTNNNFGFIWPELGLNSDLASPNIDKKFIDVDSENKVFDEKFIKNHSYTHSIKPPKCKNGFVSFNSISDLDNDFYKKYNYHLVSFWGELYLELKDINIENYKEEAADIWKSIEFSNRYKQIMHYAEELKEKLGQFVVLHARNGDTVCDKYRVYGISSLYIYVFPLELVTNSIKKIKEDYKILISSPDEEFLELCKNTIDKNFQNRIYYLNDFYKKDFSKAECDFFSFNLISKADIIYGPISQFKNFACLISDNNIISKSILDLFNHEEQYSIIKENIEKNTINKIYKACSYGYLYLLSCVLKYDNNIKIEYLQKAYSLDDYNLSYKIKHISLLMDSGQIEKAEQELKIIFKHRKDEYIKLILSDFFYKNEFISDWLNYKKNANANYPCISLIASKIFLYQNKLQESILCYSYFLKNDDKYKKITLDIMQFLEAFNVNNKDNLLSFYSQHGTAKQRVQNQLSYKLGQVFIINSKTILETVLIPFFLLATIISHKQEQKKYQAKIKKDPSLKLPPLEEYPDYEEAIKFKNHLSYQLGQILISSFKFWYKGKIFTLPFKMMKLYKNFKQKV